MRLFFINRYYWPDESATSLMLTDLAQGLAALGHEVHVVTSRQLLEDPGAALPPRETHQSVHIYRLRTTRFGRQRLLTRAIDYLSFYLSALTHLLWNLRRNDIVIAKTDPPLISVVAAIATAVKGGRLVNWLQDVYPEIAFRLGALRENGLLGRSLVSMRNWSLRRAAANVAVGERINLLVEQQVPGCGPVTVIHNWSQPLHCTPAPSDDNPIRRQLGLAGKVVFCYSGNLGRAHEFGVLIEAAAQLDDRDTMHFLIIGGGARMSVLREEVRRRRLRNWSYLPYQPRERLHESLAAADVHVVSLNPALEGLIVPSKVYGVLAAARPCLFLGSADGEVAQMLAAADCGISSTPGDAVALAAALLELAQNPARRRQLGANALCAYLSRYTPEQSLETWRRLLSRTADHANSSSFWRRP